MTDISNVLSISAKLDELEETLESQMDQDINIIDIQDTVLKDSLKNQIILQLSWEELLREAEYVMNDMEVECERIYSEVFKEISGNSYKNLTLSEAKIYTESNEDYVTAKKVLNRSKKVRSNIETVVDAIRSRRYILKNLCDSLKEGTENYII